MKRIFLIRHGETKWSLSGQHTGLTDLPLLEAGQKQARALAVRLKGHHFNKVFVSPLARATETCQISDFYNQATLEPDLVEWNYGKYEGLTTQQILLQDPDWSIFTRGAPDGESVADMTHRVDRMLKKIEPLTGDIALFSSGHILRSIAARWLKLPVYDGIHFLLNPASISILGYEKLTPAIVLWNDTSHLTNGQF